MKTRTWQIGLSLAFVLSSLAACSSGQAPSAESAPPAAEPSAPVSQAPSSSEALSSGGAVPAGSGPVIEVWECQWGTEAYESALHKLAQQATDANIDGKGIKVEAALISWDSYYNTFLTAVQSNTAPGIASEASTGPVLYAEMGAALDLKPILDAWEAEGNPRVTEVPKERYEYFQYKGIQAGIPNAMDSQALLYNKDLLAGAGIDGASLPTSMSWTEFHDLLVKVKEHYPDKVPMVMAVSLPSEVQDAFDWVNFTNGGSILTEDIKPNLLSPRTVEIMKLFKQYFDEGLFGEGAVSYSDAVCQRMFESEEAVFYMSSPGSFRNSGIYKKVGVGPLLTGPSEPEAHSKVAYNGYHAFNQNGYPEETLAVLKYWLENDEILYTEGQHNCIHILPSMAKSVHEGDAVMTAYIDQMFSNPRAIFAWPLKSLYPFHAMFDSEATAAVSLQEILTGADVETALEGANENVADVLSQYGY